MVQSISMCTNLKWLSVAGNGLTSLKGVETLIKLTVRSLSLSSMSCIFLACSDWIYVCLANLRALLVLVTYDLVTYPTA